MGSHCGVIVGGHGGWAETIVIGPFFQQGDAVRKLSGILWHTNLCGVQTRMRLARPWV